MTKATRFQPLLPITLSVNWRTKQVLVNYAVNYGGSGTFTFGFLFRGLNLDSFPVLDDVLANQKPFSQS